MIAWCVARCAVLSVCCHGARDRVARISPTSVGVEALGLSAESFGIGLRVRHPEAMAPTSSQWLQRHPCARLPAVAIDADLIAASIYDNYSVGPSIRPICTRYCFTMTNLIQVCSNFH